MPIYTYIMFEEHGRCGDDIHCPFYNMNVRRKECWELEAFRGCEDYREDIKRIIRGMVYICL